MNKTGQIPTQQSRFDHIATAALLIALGNIASRLLGLVRMSTIAALFGRGQDVAAYNAAWTVPRTLYDMLINGAVSAALVPVLSEYAEGDQDEFWRLVSSVFSLVLLLLCVLVALLVWQAPLAASLLVQPSRPELRAQTAYLMQLLLPGVLFMGLSALMTAVLFARRRFLLPAFAGATFNAGIILGAVLLHQRMGIHSLAVGTLIGGIGQVALQAVGLRDMPYRFMLKPWHPALRRIALLYAPVALGILFSVIGTFIDRRLASGYLTALPTMEYATTLIQFPLGLIATAVSLAVLPTLSRQSATADEEAFRQTLAMGLKVVLLLVIPATIGLAALAGPITALLFERGLFNAQDTAATARALLFYLPGLPAAALDQVLIFAFYARQNTLVPNLVQGVAIIIYLVTVFGLFRVLPELGFLNLVLGNSAQWIGHALLIGWLLHRSVPLHGLRLGETLGKVVLASSAMGLAIIAVTRLLSMGTTPVVILLAGGCGILIYIGSCILLRVEAFQFFLTALAQRFKRKVG